MYPIYIFHVAVTIHLWTQKFQFEPECIWRKVTPKAKQFVSSLLVTDPRARPSAEEAQKLAWLQEKSMHEAIPLNKCSVSRDVVEALIRFKKFNEMHKLFCEVVSFTLLPHQIEDLRKEFKKIDKKEEAK